MTIEEKIEKFFKENAYYMKTEELHKLGINKSDIKRLEDEGFIKKVSHGIYMYPNLLEDPFYILQLRYPDVIFSYNTAFYLHNIGDYIPSILDITTKRGKQVRGNYNIHYQVDNKYEIGITTINSPFGNPIKVYDVERTICDMLKRDKEFDLDTKNKILNEYFNSNYKNIELLEEYSKKLNVFDKVNVIIEVMMKW